MGANLRTWGSGPDSNGLPVRASAAPWHGDRPTGAGGWSRSRTGRRSVSASAGIVFLDLVALTLLMMGFGLHTGIWAAPVFVPLWLWMFASAFARHTLRPRVLARPHGMRRLAGVLLGLGVFCGVWAAWSAEALGAWCAHHGGLHMLSAGFSTIPLPSFPYGAVIGVSPVLMLVLCGVLILLGMLALPGRSVECDTQGGHHA